MPNLRVSVIGMVLVEENCSVHIQLGGSSVRGNPLDTVNLNTFSNTSDTHHSPVLQQRTFRNPGDLPMICKSLHTYIVSMLAVKSTLCLLLCEVYAACLAF